MYLLTRFSNKFILPWREIVPIHGEGVDYIVDSRLFQLTEEVISAESNVLVHEDCIHTHEVEQECFGACG